MPFLAYVWIAVMIFAVVVEMSTYGLVAIWFMPSALVAMILALCNVPFWIQITVFMLLSLACLFLARPLLAKRNKTVATNIDAIIGEKAMVTEKIENIAGCGQVKVNGQYWTARAVEDSDTYEAGEVVHVIAVEGVKLICKK